MTRQSRIEQATMASQFRETLMGNTHLRREPYFVISRNVQGRKAWIDYLLVNEVEGALLSGYDNPEKMAGAIHTMYPNANVVLTLGCAGSVFVSATGTVLKGFGMFQRESV